MSMWLTLSALAAGGLLLAQPSTPSSAQDSVRRMSDGNRWMTRNLSARIHPSWCYDDSEADCVRYGRLYTWESAKRACESLGTEWRLPTDEEWRRLAKQYGGVSADSEDRGKKAYRALTLGGDAKFDAVLGGGRDGSGQYARGDAHGFYWTSTAIDGTTAWYYNFGVGSPGTELEFAL